jgi:hypothetical protein
MNRYSIVLAILFAGSAYAESGTEPTAEAATDAAVDAVWSEHQVDFHYFGNSLEQTIYYQCDSLRAKLERLLRLAGARRDIEVRTSGCYINDAQQSYVIRADLHFHSPTVAKLAEPASPGDKPLPAAAKWQPVKLQLGWTSGFDPGDCLLVEQFTLQVLKHFDVRNLASNLPCGFRHPPPRGKASLSFDALIATHASEEESILAGKQPKKREDELKSERKD